MADELTNYSVETVGGSIVRVRVTRQIDSAGVWEGETIPAFDEFEIRAGQPGVPPGLFVAIDALTAQLLSHGQSLRTPKP